jgi:predicted transport protein
MELRKLEKLLLQTSKVVNEKWIQERIAEDPQILGLGDLILKDKERIQPASGRLDLLLQDSETNRRYEVELQLGKVDESHIIRTIEYWDIERKRYPQYDHCAVIIAEEITSRFLNFIIFFDFGIAFFWLILEVSLTFTTVLDEMTLGMVDEDEEVYEVTDRAYWIKRGSEKTVKMADDILGIIKEFTDDNIELKYNKFYIGLAKDGLPYNFAAFRPRKNAVNVEIKLPFSEETQQEIEDQGLDDMGYDKKWNQYRLRLTDKEIKNKREYISKLLQKAYSNFR